MAKDNQMLVKCSNCQRAFYIEMTTKGEITLKCPFCEKEVSVIINGGVKNGTTQP